MCSVFKVSRSGYYEWVKNKDKETQHKKNRKELEQRIRRIFLDSRRLYGSRKNKEALEQQGFYVTGKTVARIMKELGLKSRTIKKYKATTNSKHNLPVYENMLDLRSLPKPLIVNGWRILPIFPQAKAGCIWLASWIYTAARSSDFTWTNV